MGHFRTSFWSPRITLWFHQLNHRYILCGNHWECSAFLIRSTQDQWLSGVDMMSVIPISTYLIKPSQSTFSMLYLPLKGTSCGDTSTFIFIAMSQYCVLGIISKTCSSHRWVILLDTNDRSRLYPCFHLALLNDLVSFGSWIIIINNNNNIQYLYSTL